MESFNTAITQLETAHRIESGEEEVNYILGVVKKMREVFIGNAGKEERFLFPLINLRSEQMKIASEMKELGDFISELKENQQWIKTEISKIRRITLEYHCPVNASPSHKLAYARLSVLEQDFNRLAFIEEEFLFPKLQKIRS